MTIVQSVLSYIALAYITSYSGVSEVTVDFLLEDEKDYSRKVDTGLRNHFKEVPVLLKSASLAFVRDLMKLLNYLPE
ncbi:hypothetical protein [Bacillus clarus]|uniref:Uncharacterized protein n=1 Tax=Bacillus clarus TaxID=2338372 RepID=A0A090YTD0_9BACI|nr:hypothetical protein [Bacillus clarus]KFN01228.1 hypothetical protein DJ93_5074 [Bacillus clarus]